MLKHALPALAIGAASLFFSNQTFADTGPYVSLTAGYTLSPETDIENTTYSFEDAELITLAVGGEIEIGGKGLLIEAEWIYHETELEQVGDDHPLPGFDLSTHQLMVNVIYQDQWFPILGLKSYIGAGIGIALTDNDTFGLDTGDDDQTYSAQLLLGLSYDLPGPVDLKAGYRLSYTGDASLYSSTEDSDGFLNHTFEFGVRYHF